MERKTYTKPSIKELDICGCSYDLSGRRLKEMPKSGIVIMNNKKIYIK